MKKETSLKLVKLIKEIIEVRNKYNSQEILLEKGEMREIIKKVSKILHRGLLNKDVKEALKEAQE